MVGIAPMAPAQPQIYSELETLPGRVVPVQYFSALPNEDGESKGMEFSSAVQFQGRILLSDDEVNAIKSPALVSPDAGGLALFEVMPAPAGAPLRLRRPFAEAFAPVLATPDAFDDMESTTVRGQTLYSFGSHSYNKSGKRRPQREVAIRIVAAADGSVTVQRKPTGLRDKLVTTIASMPGVNKSVEEIATEINIEGLTIDPNSNDLLIGLKRPLVGPEERALVFRIANIDAFFDSPDAELSPQLEAVFSVDRSGISSIEWDPVLEGYMLATNAKSSEYQESSLWFARDLKHAPREICRFRSKALEGVARISEGPYAGNLILAFDEETVDKNWRTRDGGSVAILKWGQKRH